MNGTISEDVRARVDAHLDAVDSQLSSAGVPREKRRGIVDDLETHILEMIDATGKSAFTPEDVNEILSHLDPPEAYSADSTPPARSPTHSAPEIVAEPPLCREARQGVWWIALAILSQVAVTLAFVPWVGIPAPVVIGSSGNPVPVPATVGPSPGAMIFLALIVAAAVVAPIVGTSLGWIAVERIRNSGGKLYGLLLAAFEALFYPLIVVWIGAFMLWYFIIVAYYDGTDVPNRGRAVWLIAGSCTAVLASAGLCWLLRRLSRPREAHN